MKKLILLALTLAMLLTAVGVLPMSAAADTAVTLPNCVYAQTTAPASNKQDVRFVSEVPVSIVNENVSALGYEVVATFKNAAGDIKVVTYDVEGNTVYSAITATDNGTTNKVEPKEGYYFFALTITDVPTNLGDIFFAVKTYTRVGESKSCADVKNFCYENGVNSTRQLMYADNFDSYAAATNAAALTALGWKDTKLGTVNMSVGNGSVTLNNQWAAYQFLEANQTLAEAKSYEVDMDVTINKVSNFTIFLQTSDSAEGDKISGGSTWVSFRGYSTSATAFNSFASNGTTAGNLGALVYRYVRESGTTKNTYCMTSEQGAASNTAYNSNLNTKLAAAGATQFGWTSDADNGISNTIHVKVAVDNVANTLSLYVNGVLVVTAHNITITTVERLSLLCQNDNAKVDNLMVTCK